MPENCRDQAAATTLDYNGTTYNGHLVTITSQAEQKFLANTFMPPYGPRVWIGAYRSDRFTNGISIVSIRMSKGLEFDEVLIPAVSTDNYHMDFDRSLLYIAPDNAYLFRNTDPPDWRKKQISQCSGGIDGAKGKTPHGAGS